MKPREPKFIDHGIIVEHDQRCAVLPGENAVYFLNNGVFFPSYKAQKQGWTLVKANTGLKRFILKHFFKTDLPN